MTKLREVCAAAALAMMASGAALAETTANVGIMSDYIFRGVFQTDATAFAGIDVNTESGFYIGGWGTNLKEGLEYDAYLGYAHGGDNLDWYVGMTGYYYSDDFDKTYQELNVGFTYGFMTIDYALGDYNTPAGLPAGKPEQTYQYVGATFAPDRGPYYFLGRTDYKNIGRAAIIYDEFGVPVVPYEPGRIQNTGKNGYWVEIGKSFEIMDDMELSVAALYEIHGNAIHLGRAPESSAEFAMVVSLTKTLSIGE